MEKTVFADNRITKKLRSETGASITFALLLFLVCAVLSAVILVAGTTAAGRMKNLAATDQRYYAVTSAAELLSELMDDQTVSVISFSDESSRSFLKPMNEITDEDLNISFSDLDEDPDDEGAPDTEKSDRQTKPLISIVQTAALNSLNGKAYTSYIYITSQDDSLTDPLAVTVREELAADGNLIMTVYNTNGKPYKLKLEFSSDVKDGLPPVSRTDNRVTSGREVTWHLTRIVSEYDDTVVETETDQQP